MQVNANVPSNLIRSELMMVDLVVGRAIIHGSKSGVEDFSEH